MSTLSVSIIALIAFVVGAVVLFNFWQARGGQRQLQYQPAKLPAALLRLARRVTRRQSESGSWPGGTRLQRDGRRRQTGGDRAAWARQRREPTLTSDDDTIPTQRFSLDDTGFNQPGPAATGRAARIPAGPRVAPRPAGAEEDLGPPQFETPHLDPSAVVPAKPAPRTRAGRQEAPRFELPRFAAPRFEAPRIEGERFESSRDERSHGQPARSPFPADGIANQPGLPTGTTSRAHEPPFENTQPDGIGNDDDTGPAEMEEPLFVPAAVDHVVTLIPRSPVNADRLIALTSSLRHAGSKPIRMEIDSGQGRWIALQSGTMVGCLRCSVLLANRQGALNAVELSDYFAAMESLSGAIGAQFVTPEMNQVLRHARELDAVAARLDTQVHLSVECGEPVNPARLAAIARKLELSDRGGGRFACFTEAGEQLYSLTAGETDDVLAFILDVPRTAQGHDAWRSMVACASSCAQLVRGRVVDSAGRGMSVGMIESVAQLIDKRYQELAEVGLKAGEPATLRVFN